MRAMLLVVGLSACATTPALPEGAHAVSLPVMPLRTLDDQPAALADAIHGRPALVSLWATWCESCATEFGALGRLAPKAEAKGAYVVAIAEGEAPATVAAFVRARGLAYPNLVDEAYAVGDAIGARRIPATLVLDRKGRVVFRGAALDRPALLALDRAIEAE